MNKETISEINSTVNGVNSRLDAAEEKISKLEDIAIEMIQDESQKDKRSGVKEQRHHVA